MADTLTAPAPSGTPAVPATPVVPAPVAPVVPAADPTNAVAAAGAALKTAGGWEKTNFPAAGAIPVAEDGTVADPAKPEPTVAAEPEFTQDGEGKWHRADGTFATADEIALIDAEIAAHPAPEAEKPADPAAAAATSETVTLRRRDGSTREVIVDDAELAQEIRQNMNDGMRKRDYLEKKAEIDAKAAEFAEFQAMLRANPEAVILNHLPKEKQIAIATALLAPHFDDLVDIINTYNQQPAARIRAVAETQTAIRTQDDQFRALVASQRQAAAVRQSVAALIPETAPDEVQGRFWKFASMELTAAIDRGQAVTTENVKTLLSDLITHYGFDATGTKPAAAAPRISSVVAPPAAPAVVPTSPPAAVPANEAAKAMAAQRRIKLTQRNRANAAAVPPAGAGAAPVRLPPVPAGASIEEASRTLKSQRSWTS